MGAQEIFNVAALCIGASLRKEPCALGTLDRAFKLLDRRAESGDALADSLYARLANLYWDAAK
jgi:hypothetical protein